MKSFFGIGKNNNLSNNTPIKQYKSKPKNQHFDDLFSFKKQNTVQNYQHTITNPKKPIRRTSSFQQLSRVLQKTQNESKQNFKNESNDDYLEQTKTIAVSRKTRQKSFYEVKRSSFGHNPCQFEQVDMYSQTITMPQPIHKNKKTSTQDLDLNQRVRPKNNIKRDSFVQELISNLYKKK